MVQPLYHVQRPCQRKTWFHVMSTQAAAAALSGASIAPFGYSFIDLLESKRSDEEGEGMTNGEEMQNRGRTYRRLLYGSATTSCPAPTRKTT